MKTVLVKLMGRQGQCSILPAVDGIKIFDNDDQATKHYCCLPTARSYRGRQQ